MILVLLTDFSEAATNAAHYVAAMSHQVPVDKLILYHSIEPAHLATELPVAEGHHQYEVSLRKLGELRTMFESRLTPGTPISIFADDRPLEVSAPKVAAENHADLLVMGTRRRHGIAEALYESTASLLVSTCTIPILIVPAGSQYGVIRNIAFASDLKRVAAQTPVRQIKRFKALLQARLFVLNIYDGDDDAKPDNVMHEQRELHARLDDQQPEIHFLPDKHIAEAIIRFTREHEIHLVIAVPGKHSFPGSLFHQGITRSLASRSKIPLLLLHPES